MKTIKCKAILFDLDGVLVDSIASVEKHWRTWARKVELDDTQVLATIHGRRAIDAVQLLAPHLVAEEELAFIEGLEVNDTRGLVAIPGAQALLTSLPHGHWSIVTSGTLRLATARLQAGGHPIPEKFITAELVTRGKPDPEGYLLGAALLGIEPSQCVVFEDAKAGIEAAHAAGMQAVAVGNTYHRDELATAQAWVPTLAYAHVHYNSADELPLEIVITEAEDN